MPLFSDLYASTPVASVGDDVITVRDLAEMLAVTHQEHGGRDGGAGKRDVAQLLERLIDVRLVVLEARDMGLAELPEVKKEFADHGDRTLRETLKTRVTKDVTFDAAEVEQAYRESAREWKIRSVLLRDEESPKKMLERIAQGESFEDVAKQLVAEKKASGGEEGAYVRLDAFLPHVAAAVQAMKPGEVSAALRVPTGYTVFKLLDVRQGDHPDVKAAIENASRSKRKTEALKAYYRELVKKHATIDEALLKRLDFEAKTPGFAALAKDQRPLARIKGEKPVTIADLAAAMRQKFFHGVETAAREKKLNKEKEPGFESLLFRRLLMKQAALEKIAETEEFRREVAEHQRSILFGLFIEKVIVPDIQVMESEGKEYYEKNLAEFTFPQLYKLDSVAFVNAADAQSAVERLRAGTDFKWMKANATGQADRKKQGIQLTGTTVTAKSLPAPLVTAIAGSRRGDYRQYAADDGNTYVIQVLDETPAQPQPYVDAREGIVKKLFAEKRSQAIKDWTAKLRKATEIEVFITQLGE